MDNKKHIKRSFASDFSRDAREGHVGGLEIKLPIRTFIICKHNSYCYIKELRGVEHCDENYVKHCGQPKKFYNKWGEQGNSLGVGS